MLSDLMIDLETLDTSPTATVLTIGAVKFDPFGDDSKNPSWDTFYVKVDVDSCDKLGCTISSATMDWWSKQSPEAQEEAFSPDNRLPIEEALSQLHKFARGSKRVWSHGAGFDVVICETLFRKVERAIPWGFWEVRDTRTIFDLGINPNRAKVTAHHALEDAKDQALGVQAVMRSLKTSTTSGGNYLMPLSQPKS